ncbi:MAG: RNA polymerase sigma factor [Bacteroidales bacterium]|nr:RNA polymerase sigma factor [Bacteroidales bacterium]
MMKNSIPEELVKLEDKLYSFAFVLTENKENAKDLVQETNLKVLNNQNKFMPNTNFVGWVYTLMKNLFINNYRKVIKHQIYTLSRDDIYDLTNVYNVSNEGAESKIEVNQILTLLNNLDDDLKIPLELFMAGYRYYEIADKLSIPMGTVKSRIFAGRKKLSAELEKF